jgi:putative methyltransferase
MQTKHRVLLVQVNYQYGENIFVPYSIGSLQAYAETIPEVVENFKFLEPVFLRQEPAGIIKKIEEPSVVGFSCYLWNWEYNKMLAKLMRAAFPKCLIVFGGTQIPDASDNFFVEHPYADLLVHHEGEFVFADILRESLSARPDYTKIAGLSVRVEGTRTLKTPPSIRIRDLSVLPSPYLVGIFDFLLDRGFVLNASQETNRGCPYSCTFCDWGGNTFNKVTHMEESRLLEEFEWFGRNKVEYIFNCDANYGILPRDYDLTVKMLEVRAKHGGYPKKFRMCTAKKSNDKIFAITKLLSDGNMNKGATLSFQSMDETTLDLVKRTNIKIDKFSELMDRYREAGIATYTELILGMPGETYESSKQGIDTLLDAQADAVNLYVYVCAMLPNSEMSHPVYVERNGIKSVRMPILLAHSTPEAELSEYQNVVVETNSMSREDWHRTYLFYWAVQAFHCLGLASHVAMLFHKQFGIRYSDFYEKLINYFSADETSLIGREIASTRNVVFQSTNGGRLDIVNPKFGEIYWPLEEASFLNFVTDKKRFFEEIRIFIGVLAQDFGSPIDSALLDDIVFYQSSLVKDPYVSESSVILQYDLHDYFSRLRDKETVPSISPSLLKTKGDKSFGGDLESYAREIVWYGRKGGRFHHTNLIIEHI